MIDPDFDPLSDLNECLIAIGRLYEAQAEMARAIQFQTRAIDSLNNGLLTLKKQIKIQELRIDEVDARTAGRSPRP